MNSESRDGARVIWLAVHTTEGIMRAADLRAWTTWPGSSHACSDETGVLMTPADGFVPYELAAWTLRNGNHKSENIEQCGWARWTRADWLARPELLDATARWLADRSKARGIPLVHLSLADIKAGKPGVIGHADYTYATGDGTHTDPGPNYPWDVVIAKARAYAAGQDPEDDMALTPADEAAIKQWGSLVEAVSQRSRQVEGADPRYGGHLIVKHLTKVLANQAAQAELIRQLAEKQGTPIDMAAIEAVVEKGVADAISSIETTVNVASKG